MHIYLYMGCVYLSKRILFSHKFIEFTLNLTYRIKQFNIKATKIKVYFIQTILQKQVHILRKQPINVVL